MQEIHSEERDQIILFFCLLQVMWLGANLNIDLLMYWTNLKQGWYTVAVAVLADFVGRCQNLRSQIKLKSDLGFPSPSKSCVNTFCVLCVVGDGFSWNIYYNPCWHQSITLALSLLHSHLYKWVTKALWWSKKLYNFNIVLVYSWSMQL